MASTEPFWPQEVADLAAQRIVDTIGLGRDAQHAPRLAVAALDEAGLTPVILGQQASGEIVLVPAGLDQHD